MTGKEGLTETTGVNMSSTNENKDNKKEEIRSLIHSFCDHYLDTELESYCFNLCKTIGRKRKLNILRGKSEQWAASIIYVIARFNFLFDKEHEYHITADDICTYFDTNKSTTGNKATQIERACNLSVGARGYCSEEISELFMFYELESGFVIPKHMLDELTTKTQTAEKDESENKESIYEKRQREIKEQQEAKSKRRIDNENQLGLFD